MYLMTNTNDTAALDFGSCSMAQLVIANTHRAATAADIAEAQELDRQGADWDARIAEMTERTGAHQHSQISADMARKAAFLRAGRSELVAALRVNATGEVLFAVPTSYGSAFRCDGKWIGGNLKFGTYAKRGFTPVRAWKAA